MKKPAAHPDDLTRLERLPGRARYDRKSLYDLLDAGYLCHMAFMRQGVPVILPMAYVRSGHELIVHGAAANRLLRTILQQEQVTIAVTHLDGLVLARSAFNHSFNYRSAVIFGTPRLLTEPGEKRQALERFTNQVVPGRWQEVQLPTDRELQATRVVAVAIDEFSVKVRTGPPSDNPADYALPHWAGVIPRQDTWGPILPDPRMAGKIKVPDSVCNLINKVKK